MSKLDDLINSSKRKEEVEDGVLVPGDASVDQLMEDFDNEIDLDSVEESSFEEEVADEPAGSEKKKKGLAVFTVLAGILAFFIYYLSGFSKASDVNPVERTGNANEVGSSLSVKPEFPDDPFSNQLDLINEANAQPSGSQKLNSANEIGSPIEINEKLLSPVSSHDQSLSLELASNTDPIVTKELGDPPGKIDISINDDKKQNIANAIPPVENIPAKVDTAINNTVQIKSNPPKTYRTPKKNKHHTHDIKVKLIIKAANNCASCIDHALIVSDGKEYFVGQGDSFKGHKVSIVGDRLNLSSSGIVRHNYWITR